MSSLFRPLLTLTLLAGLLGLPAAAQAPTPPASTPTVPPPTGGLRPVERTFLERVADLSRRQIALGRLGASQAASTDVRLFAQQVASDHQQISDSVAGLRQRKGALLDRGLAVPTAGRFEQLVQKPGADFDREFVRLVGGLQSDVLTLFEQTIREAKDADVRDLIGAYLPVLRDHQNRATELQKTFD